MLRTTSAKLVLIETACSTTNWGRLALSNSPCLRQAEEPYTADGSTKRHCQSCSAAFITDRLMIHRPRPKARMGTTYHTLRQKRRTKIIACSAVVIGIRKATMLAE